MLEELIEEIEKHLAEVDAGQAVPANQIHDFHSPISSEGLYWVTPVPMSD